MLNFQPVSLGIKPLVESYTLKYGEGSCQHSFVSSFCLRDKYGDEFCEKDGFLYTLRSRRCTDSERVYLFPHGDRANIKQALAEILDDAHSNGARVRFETITSSAKDIVCGLFPEAFRVESSRDLAEYLCSTNDLVKMPGRHFMNRRNMIHKFFREYGSRCEILRIAPEHIESIRNFQGEWLDEKLLRENNPLREIQLQHEDDGVQCGLDNFFELGLSGIVILIDGEIHGYMYGSPLSAECFDAISGKGDVNIPDISSVLKCEFTRMCCEGFKYVNLEEDLGVEGLRRMKTLYMPAYMIEKFILTEK